MSDLYAELIRNDLNERLNDATLAGLYYDIYLDTKGLKIMVNIKYYFLLYI